MQSVMEARLQQRAMQSMAACVRRLGHALQRNLLFSWRVRTAAECSGPPSGERQEVHLSPQTDEVEATLEAERRQVEKLKGELAEERKKLQEMQKIQVSDSGNDIEATEGQGVQEKGRRKSITGESKSRIAAPASPGAPSRTKGMPPVATGDVKKESSKIPSSRTPGRPGQATKNPSASRNNTPRVTKSRSSTPRATPRVTPRIPKPS